jgi:molybdopterin-guanine dinucleotide biosynthesis protein A
MEIEAIVLTGGTSTRMGQDKASMRVDDESLAQRTANRLIATGCAVTICGSEPIRGRAFLADAIPHAGPLVALANFKPRRQFVFVAACDMPRFDSALASVLSSLIGSNQAAVPKIEGRLQPLAALYSAAAFPIAKELVDQGKRSMMAWLDALKVRTVEETELRSHGINPTSVSSANTPEELARLVAKPARP